MKGGYIPRRERVAGLPRQIWEGDLLEGENSREHSF